ncbi:MAG TPA: glucose 1-dehydrogenase [Ilumatobacter sp.]|nr:glucose 1-dehydrogenase [Ilumatobacter sp.]
MNDQPALFDLTGKVAVITGSTRGIGLAIAVHMAQHGARVVVSSRRAEACAEVADQINRERPGSAIGVACNISHKDQLAHLVATANAHYGQIDVLVCNAAVNPYAGPMVGCPDDAFDKVMGANIRSNHWLCSMVLPDMQRRRDGVIIVVSSIGGMIGSELLGAYTISKAADMQLVRNIAVEYGPHNVRANSIAPGMVRTDFARALWDDPVIHERVTSRTPLRRVAEPDEIAGVAVMLASGAGAFITGQNLVVDGGVTIAAAT